MPGKQNFGVSVYTISFVIRERPVRNESYSVQLQFGVKYVGSIKPF